MVAAILGAMLLATPREAQAAPASCPTFRVLHNDKIGKIYLPAGTYDMAVFDSTKLSCGQASKLFTRFLQDWDGVLPYPWVGRTQGTGKATFRRGPNSLTGFSVEKGSGGGGGGGGQPASCPGYFQVLHNDRIGSFYIPKGKYRITLINNQRFSCSQAVKKFQQFLLDFDGQLPWPWVLNQSTATFYKRNSRATGFKINRAYNPPGPKPSPSGRTYVRCPGTFRVLNNDRIGQLVLPRGPYYISVLSGPTMPCQAASNRFRQFLNYPSGALPDGWRLIAAQAKFTRGAGKYTFRVKQAFPPR